MGKKEGGREREREKWALFSILYPEGTLKSFSARQTRSEYQSIDVPFRTATARGRINPAGFKRIVTLKFTTWPRARAPAHSFEVRPGKIGNGPLSLRRIAPLEYYCQSASKRPAESRIYPAESANRRGRAVPV